MVEGVQAIERGACMLYFKLIRKDLKLGKIREELASSTMWVDMESRPGRPATQANTDRIQLRTNRRIPGVHYHDVHETIDLPAWFALDATREFVLEFLRERGGILGHVRVTKLDASANIPLHVDIGAYCEMRDRYHLVINTEGTLFTAGDETVTMHENELWWFDNKALHSIENLGHSPRTHLIFDILPPDKKPFQGIDAR